LPSVLPDQKASPVKLRLQAFIDAIPAPPPAGTLGCLDFAATLDAFTSLMGANTDLIFFEPFGYLKPTALAGLSAAIDPSIATKSNNPFFKSKGIAASPLVPDDVFGYKKEGNSVIAVDSDGDKLVDRADFNLHSFVLYKDKVADAAAGPHLATESLEEYFDAVVDRNTKVEAGLAGDPKKDAVIREVLLSGKE